MASRTPHVAVASERGRLGQGERWRAWSDLKSGGSERLPEFLVGKTRLMTPQI